MASAQIGGSSPFFMQVASLRVRSIERAACRRYWKDDPNELRPDMPLLYSNVNVAFFILN